MKLELCAFTLYIVTNTVKHCILRLNSFSLMDKSTEHGQRFTKVAKVDSFSEIFL
jgi:hypothetical protein